MNNLNLTMEWKRIPKDKFGFFEDNGTMCAELPIIVAEEYDEDMYPILHYVDEENWWDSLSDFSRSSYKYYLPIPKLEK